ncbi:MAG TPA: HPr family phosphocarrier protein [Ghiorsea sp.]|nr:HPr family phosphocarrier protein [Ghiorsea sp.]HIP06639.1 HPr family phosphocarrier protein [Mariprofundaceae bacterium]
MKKVVTIRNKLGLHARTSAQFVTLAGQFSCDIQLQRDDMIVNGKSLMAILTLAASQHTNITIMTDGEQAEQALNALVLLVEQGFGEEL